MNESIAMAETGILILTSYRSFHLSNTKGKTMTGFHLTFMVDMLATSGK